MKFRDLNKQYEILRTEIDVAMAEVITSARFISGPQVEKLEKELAKYVGVKHCVSCANGTDALTLALMVWGIGEGDAVFVPDFTFFSSGECPALEGATPVFVDVDARTYNMAPKCLEQSIEHVAMDGRLKPRAVVAVDLFGLPADFEEIRTICDKYDLLLLEDGAQGFGGMLQGKRACSFGNIATTSFFPAKPLGCYGDGGAIFTDDDIWAKLLRSYCVHGKSGSDKYMNARIGMNSRLDTLQAAILLPKLKAFREQELEAVNHVADWYSEHLAGTGLTLPIVPEGYLSSWAQYTVQLPVGTNRSLIQETLKAQGIPSMVYYKKPMHVQEAFAGTISAEAICPVTEQLCETVLSLPMHPYLTETEVDVISDVLKKAL